jgi:hypothetical protein
VAEDRERPSVAKIAHEVRQVRQDVARLEVEVAQQDDRFARRDVIDARLIGDAAVTAERFASIQATLAVLERDIERFRAHDTSRRNLVFAALASGVVALIVAAVTAGVLG